MYTFLSALLGHWNKMKNTKEDYIDFFITFYITLHKNNNIICIILVPSEFDYCQIYELECGYMSFSFLFSVHLNTLASTLNMVDSRL